MANHLTRTRDPRSTESYGMGQSGYAAGRVAGDPSLQLETHNRAYPPAIEDHLLEYDDTEDVVIGRGTWRWIPAAA